MRFSCDKCSAKFTIADEKVRGKIVAVKCSKCGNRITVNGKSLVEERPVEEAQPEERTRVASLQDLDALRATAQQAAAPAPAAAAPTPVDAPAPLAAPAPVAARAPVAPRAPVAAEPPPPEPAAPPAAPAVADGWYAIIDGQQLGPMPGAQFAEEVASRRVDERTYVWRDGQGDWKRAGEIAELASLLAPPPAPAAAPAPPPNDDPFADLVQSPAPAAAAPRDPFDFDDGAATHTGAAPRTATPGEKKIDRLFDGELDSVPTQTGKALDLAALVASDLEKEAAPPPAAADPFSAVPDNPNISKPGEVGEQTRFFMNKAGVTRRNPWWKIAIAAVLIVVVPIGTLFLLSQLEIVNLQVTTVDEATGEEVQASVFSSDGLHGLRDKLLGGKPKPVAQKPKARPAVAKDANKEARPAAARDDEPLVARPEIKFGELSDADKAKAAELYKSDDKEFKGPRVVAEKTEKVAVDGAGSLEPKVVNEVFSKNLKAFQTCNENELRRNPDFKGGRINITFTVGPSGTVTKAAIDRADVDQSPLGECLRQKARRVVFPAFEGEAVDVEIPLVLTKLN